MLVVNNFAQVRGGGIYAYNYSDAQILNSTITGNRVTLAADGAGIFTETYSSMTVSNSIVWGNQGIDISYIWGNDITNSVLGGPYEGIGNIVANPLFANAAAGNYRLLATSPAIDTGRSTAINGVTHDIDGCQVGRPVDDRQGHDLGRCNRGIQLDERHIEANERRVSLDPGEVVIGQKGDGGRAGQGGIAVAPKARNKADFRRINQMACHGMVKAMGGSDHLVRADQRAGAKTVARDVEPTHGVPERRLILGYHPLVFGHGWQCKTENGHCKPRQRPPHEGCHPAPALLLHPSHPSRQP